MISPKLLAAIKTLLDDINEMRPKQVDAESKHYFEGFPEFYVERSQHPGLYGQEFCNIEWPNLSISTKDLEDALREEAIAPVLKDFPDYAHPIREVDYCNSCGKPAALCVCPPKPNPDAPPSDAATQTGMYDLGDIPE